MNASEENLKIIFGLKVRQLRKEKGHSFSELAKKSGLSASYLNEIEKGKKYPKLDKLNALANALETSYDNLVSTELPQKLAPIAELLKSNFFSELPLEIFGVEPAQLIDLLSNAPDKLNAFLSTLIEISRNYGLQVENLYLSMLRSYQQLYDNYFSELEDKALAFRESHSLKDKNIKTQALIEILEKVYNCTTQIDGLKDHSELKALRSATTKGEPSYLLLNPALSAAQKKFAVAKEIGYRFLRLSPRSYSSSWISIDSYEEVLNNFKASYFACAVLLTEDSFTEDISNLFADTNFKPESVATILKRYECSPEMFMHRLTNLIPKTFGIRELFFLRFSTSDDKRFNLTKEMHLAGLHNPHGTALDQHYCRRWASLEILSDLRKISSAGQNELVCKVQKSKYLDSENEYLIISLAQASNRQIRQNSSVSIGLLLNEKLKSKIAFASNPSIPIRIVNETCELCPLSDCQERAAPPTIHENKQALRSMQRTLNTLIS